MPEEQPFYREERKPTALEIKQRLEREQLHRSYKKLFQDGGVVSKQEAGMVLNDLLNQCKIFHSTFFKDNTKVQDFLEGKRSVGLYIIGQLQIADLEAINKLKEGS